MTLHPSPSAVVAAVQRVLDQTPAFHQLDAGTRADIGRSLAKVGGYVSEPVLPTGALAGEAEIDGDGGVAGPAPGGSGTVGRVGELARATLNAIDFPSFVAALIDGTFRAIVDSSIKQMEAYAELLSEVAKTVDEYMEDNVTDGAAKDYLADRYGNVLQRDVSAGQPNLAVNPQAQPDGLPSFFRDLGFDDPRDLDEEAIHEVIVPAARKTIAEQRHQTLATMVLLGLSRIVVNDGEINAKLEFHIDASEDTEIRFDQTQQTIGGLAGASSSSTFTGQGILVNTASVNAQSDITVRADLTGEVTIRFSSDFMPLERFADSNAIQLINQHASVPSAPGQLPAGTPAPEQQAPAAQSVAEPLSPSDPWIPGAS